jgi:hypothetical protein
MKLNAGTFIRRYMQLTVIAHCVVNVCLTFILSETLECFLDSKLLFTTTFSQELKLEELVCNNLLYFFNLCLILAYASQWDISP